MPNLDPLVVLTVLAVMGVAASLTFAVWRAITRNDDGDSFDAALEAISTGTEISTDTLTVAVEDKKKHWTWNDWWNDAALAAGREVHDPHGFGRAVLGLIVVSLLFGLLVYPTGAAAIVLPVMIVGILRAWLSYESNKRKLSMEKQLPLLLSSLRTQIMAGQTVQSALSKVAEDLPAPLGDEIREVRSEVEVSVPLDQALTNFAERTKSRLVQFLVSSIGIAIKSGSDIVPQLTTIEDIVRQRARITGKIKSAVALAKPTSMLALLAPPAMAFWMMFTEPTWLPYFLSDGMIMGLMAVVLYLAGAFAVRIMVNNVENIG